MTESVENKNELDVSNGEKYEVGKRASYFILGTLGLLYLMNLADQQVIAAVLEMIKKDLGLSDAQAGALPTILILSTSIFAFPCAILVDRWSRRKAISVMAVFWSIAHFSTGLGSRFIHLAVSRFATGIGEAGFAPGSTSWLSFIFPKEARGRVNGVFFLFAPVGMSIGFIGGGAIAQAFGDWRMPFFVFAIPGIILGIIIWFMPDYSTVKSREERFLSRKYFSDIATLFKIRTLVFHWSAIAVSYFIIFGFIVWLPTLFIRGYNVGVGQAGMLAGAPALIGIAAAPIGGVLADMWQRRNPRGRLYFASICCLVAAVTHTASFLSMGTWLLLTIIVTMLNGFVMPMLLPMFTTVNADVTPAGLRATSAGIQVLVAALIGGAWGPLVLGALSDAWGGGIDGLVKGGLVITCAAPVAAVLFFLASKSYPEDSQKVSDEVMA